MCNFIIRPVKAYATVEIRSDDDTVELDAGQPVQVKFILIDKVVVEAENIAKEKYELAIPITTYVHMFSLKNPKEAEKEKKSKESK